MSKRLFSAWPFAHLKIGIKNVVLLLGFVRPEHV